MILSEGRRKAGSLKKTSIVWDRAISVNRREKASIRPILTPVDPISCRAAHALRPSSVWACLANSSEWFRSQNI